MTDPVWQSCNCLSQNGACSRSAGHACLSCRIITQDQSTMLFHQHIGLSSMFVLSTKAEAADPSYKLQTPVGDSQACGTLHADTCSEVYAATASPSFTDVCATTWNERQPTCQNRYILDTALGGMHVRHPAHSALQCACLTDQVTCVAVGSVP